MLGVDGPRQEMLDAARRVAAEVEAEAYERRLQHDPAFRESERVRLQREAQAAVHEAELQQLRQAVDVAGDALAEAMSAVTAIEGAPLPVSPAPARLAAIDAELAAIAKERPDLSTQLGWARDRRGSGNPQDLLARQTKLIERVKALESERPAAEAEAEAAPAREAGQRELRDEQVRAARAVEADARARLDVAERRLNTALEEVYTPVGVGA